MASSNNRHDAVILDQETFLREIHMSGLVSVYRFWQEVLQHTAEGTATMTENGEGILKALAVVMFNRYKDSRELSPEELEAFLYCGFRGK